MKAPCKAVNSKGIHLIIEDVGHRTALFLQSPGDGRIFFVVPWQGYTVVGTTETPYDKNPDDAVADEEDIQYLIEQYNKYMKTKIGKEDVLATFAGLRWLPVDQGKTLGQLSRSHVLTMTESQKGILYTIYGGKLTTYRELSQEVGDHITKHFGEFQPSRTADKTSWTKGSGKEPDPVKRFL
jgi:glycerol-3-phosphate dehydrogenase